MDVPARRIRKPVYIVSLVGLCLFSAAVNGFNAVILDNIKVFFFVLVFISIVIIYCRDIEGCYKYVVWAGVINVVVLAFQKIGYNPILSQGLVTGEEGAILGNGPRLACYLMITLPVVYSRCKPLVIVWVISTVLIQEYTALAIIPAYCMLSLTRSSKTTFILKVCCLIGSIAGMWFFRESLQQSIGIRLDIWARAGMSFFRRPLIGWGAFTWPQVFNAGNPPVIGPVNYIFNSYFQFIMGVGMLGSVWLFFVMKYYAKLFNFGVESISLLFLFSLACVEYPFEIPRLWITIACFIGFFIIKRQGVSYG